MSSNPATELPRGGRFILGVLIFGVLATAAYWVVWFGVDRDILASAHSDSYYAFENSFPLADAWMGATGTLASIALVRRRASALLWSIAAGSISVYLGLLDVLFDLENGIYRSPDTGGVIVELAINALTLSMGVVVIAWAWRSRRTLLALGPQGNQYFLEGSSAARSRRPRARSRRARWRRSPRRAVHRETPRTSAARLRS